MTASHGHFRRRSTTRAEDAGFQGARIGPAISQHARRRPQHFQHRTSHSLTSLASPVQGRGSASVAERDRRGVTARIDGPNRARGPANVSGPARQLFRRSAQAGHLDQLPPELWRIGSSKTGHKALQKVTSRVSTKPDQLHWEGIAPLKRAASDRRGAPRAPRGPTGRAFRFASLGIAPPGLPRGHDTVSGCDGPARRVK